MDSSSDCTNPPSMSDPRNTLTRVFTNSFSTLFFLIILFLAIKSILQCIRRRSSTQTELPVVQQQHQTDSSSSQAAAAALLAAIPVLIYESASKTINDPSSECENCSICLDGFEHGDTVRILPRCKHMFHKDCIDEWLPSRSIFCPVCRDQTLGEETEENLDQNDEIGSCNRNNGSTGNTNSYSSSSSAPPPPPPVIINFVSPAMF